MYETIPVACLDHWLESGYTGRIVDLRDEEAFRISHLCTAENIPYEKFTEDPMLALPVLTWDEPVLFYCARGSESMLVCNYYDRRGYRVYNLGGGYRFYRGKYAEGRGMEGKRLSMPSFGEKAGGKLH